MTTNLNITPATYFSNMDIDIGRIRKLLHGYQPNEKNIYLLYGDGNNGKSTLTNILKHILGNECITIPNQLEYEEINEIYDKLLSKKLLVMQEVEDWSTLNVELINKIISSNNAKCKILLMTNAFLNEIPDTFKHINEHIERVYFPNNLIMHKSKQERQIWGNLPYNEEFINAVNEYLKN